MALSGRPDGPGLGPPEPLVGRLTAWSEMVASDAAALGRGIDVDPLGVLVERAGIAGLRRQGTTSCGGATRLLPAADGWLAVALARPHDVDAVPAWLELDAGAAPADVWDVVAPAVAVRPAAELVERAGLLGLPVAALPETPVAGIRAHDPFEALPVRARRLGDAPARDLAAVTVVDLSALWAGPLCGRLLADAGAGVVKVESVTRPDGARLGPPAFYDLLNAGKASVAVDLATRDGRGQLAALVRAADVVIEAARPRALRQLGIDAESLIGAGGPQVWISITGYGRPAPAGDRVGFGDDTAVAGGLVVRDADGPCFCADAVADPATGLVAAAAALRGLAAGGRWLIDVALRDVAADAGRPDAPDRRLGRPPTAATPTAWHRGASRRRHSARARPGHAVPMNDGTALHLGDVEVAGEVVDVVIVGDRITAVGAGLRPPAGARRIDGGGGALLPGLHDHHLHLAAMAARAGSVPLGPPAVRTREALGTALATADAAAAPGRWLRAVDYHESVAGDLDRDDLDGFVSEQADPGPAPLRGDVAAERPRPGRHRGRDR